MRCQFARGDKKYREPTLWEETSSFWKVIALVGRYSRVRLRKATGNLTGRQTFMGSHMGFRESILVIDDDPKLLFTMTLLLKHSGYSVGAVTNARDAVRCLNSYKFSLIFLDLYLLDISGLCLLSQIRSIVPAIPVVILTGDDSVDSIIEALQAGAAGYLLKPLDPEQILHCIEKVLEIHSVSSFRHQIVHFDT